MDVLFTVDPLLCGRAGTIIKALKSSGNTIVTAESCTAGMLSAVLSRADGAGEILHGGFVTYTKDHKTRSLGVSKKVLRERGAVNELVVTQMAEGALKHSPASLSIAVTGVLGPEKDEDGNPVGLVYFCVGTKDVGPVVLKEEWGEKPPLELLQLTIAGSFDLIERALVHRRLVQPKPGSYWVGLIK